jgi:radical SAM superfamily enzyme
MITLQNIFKIVYWIIVKEKRNKYAQYFSYYTNTYKSIKK